MDFIEEIESSPCFFVPDSQREDSGFARSSSEILKQLAISGRTEFQFDSLCGKSDTHTDVGAIGLSSNRSNRYEADAQLKVMTVTGGVEGGKAGGETPDPPGEGSAGDGGGGNSGGDDGGGDGGGGGGGDDGGGDGGGGRSGSGGSGSGGDDGGGSGDGSHENQETTEQEEADVSESTPSSDNSMPQLVQPVDGTTNQSITQRRYSASDMKQELSERSGSSDLSLSASSRSAGTPADPGPGQHSDQDSPTYSQASTAVVGEAAVVDVGNISDVQSLRSSGSEASTAVVGGANTLSGM